LPSAVLACIFAASCSSVTRSPSSVMTRPGRIAIFEPLTFRKPPATLMAETEPAKPLAVAVVSPKFTS